MSWHHSDNDNNEERQEILVSYELQRKVHTAWSARCSAFESHSLSPISITLYGRVRDQVRDRTA